MKNRLIAGMMIAALALVLAVSAMAEVNPNTGLGLYTGTPAKGEISIGVESISKMNPILQTYGNEFSVDRHIYDNLVRMSHEDNATIPAAAESWEVSEDGLTWTFHIRPGQKWVNSKGEAVGDVTAHDFVFGWRELLSPKNAAEYGYYGESFKNGKAYRDYVNAEDKSGLAEVTLDDIGMHAVDDLTLVCELETYLPYFLDYVKFEVMAPIYEPFYNEVGAENYGTSPETLLFNGPFYMSEWVLENHITVTKNPYWREADQVELEKIHFVKYTEDDTRINAFMAGELDLCDLTGEQRKLIEADGYEILNYPSGYSQIFWANTTEKSDIRSKSLRKALSYAIDRQQIIDVVYQNSNYVSPCFTYGISGVAYPTFGEAVVAANGGEGLYSAHADVELAQSYLPAALEELGYTDVSEINVTLMTNDLTQIKRVSEVVQEQVRKALGIELKIEVLSNIECRARRKAKDYDLFYGSWGPDYNDPLTDLELFYSTVNNNHPGYNNPAYDAIIDATRTEMDAAAREQLFVQAESIIQEDQPVIPIFWQLNDYVVSDKIVDGFGRLPFQQLNFIYTRLSK